MFTGIVLAIGRIEKLNPLQVATGRLPLGCGGSLGLASGRIAAPLAARHRHTGRRRSTGPLDAKLEVKPMPQAHLPTRRPRW